MDNNEVGTLVAQAQDQLEQHKQWLRNQIGMSSMTSSVGQPTEPWSTMMRLATEIKLRVVRVSGATASIVYEYPDELYAWLRSEAPQHLRDTLDGSHVVDPSQPASTARQVRGEDDGV